jgi:hypothetical protein
MSKVKKGNPVEFTRKHIQHYTMGDGEYGIAIEDERADGSVKVELASGEIYLAKHIHAFAWGGWMPEDLEKVWIKHNPPSFDDFDWDD